MRVIFLGKNKRSAVDALEFLALQGATVVAVVCPETPGLGGVRLQDTANKLDLPLTSVENLYQILATDSRNDGKLDLNDIDVVLSFLFWKRIHKPLIDLPKLGCINFHPAPLPEYKGWGVYNFGILNSEKQWGVSAHYVDEDFDTGDLISVNRFPIEQESETVFSLEQTSQEHLLEQFKFVLSTLLNGRELPRTPQQQGTYYSREDTEKRRQIRTEDSSELIDRKIRAFWYPPYGGATIEHNNNHYVVVNALILGELGKRLHTELRES